MSKAEDDARDAAIAADPLANAIYRFIDDVPAASRLYPDLYALALAEHLRAEVARRDEQIDALLAVERSQR